MSEYHVLIDGDNIPIETYFNHLKENIEQTFSCNTNESLTVFCQSNLLFRFSENRNFNFKLNCCKTCNKNATDARIILQAGKLLSEGKKIIICSNDKIFLEIEDKLNITVFGWVSTEKKIKLRKKSIRKLIRDLKITNGDAYDVYLSDIQESFPRYSLTYLRAYISSLESFRITNNDAVYECTYK